MKEIESMKMYRVPKSFETISMVTKFNKEMERHANCKTHSFYRHMDMKYRNVDYINDPMQMANAHLQINYILERLQNANVDKFINDIDFKEYPMSLDLLTKIILSLKPKDRCYEAITLKMCEQNGYGIVSNFKWLYALILVSRKLHIGIPINSDPKNALVNETIRFVVFDDATDSINPEKNYYEFVSEIFENAAKTAVRCN